MPLIVTKARALACVAALAMELAGCSLVNPYQVHGNTETYWSKPSITSALRYAEQTRGAYLRALGEHSMANAGAGLAIIGAAAAILSQSFGGAPSLTIANLGASAGGVAIAHSLLNVPPKQRVFAAGVKAIDCALVVYGPLHTVNLDELGRLLTRLDDDILYLQPRLREAGPQPGATVEGILAQNALLAGDAARRRGLAAVQRLNRAGPELYFAVRQVEGRIVEALTRLEPDIAALVASLGAIRVNAGLIAGKEMIQRKPQGLAPSGSFRRSALQRELRTGAAALEETAAAINRMLDSIGELPSYSRLLECLAVDLNKVALNTSPPEALFIDNRAGTLTGVVLVTGGDPPYSAEWIQQAPPESIVIEKVEHSPGGVQARVVVRVKSAQGDGNYVLRINDRTGLGRSILVTVGRGTPAPAAPPASRNGPAPASSPEVVSIQDLLHKAGCLKDPKSVQSGVYDAKTQAAVAALMKATDKTDEDRAGRYGTAVPKDVKPAKLIEVLSPQRLTQMNGKCDPLT